MKEFWTTIQAIFTAMGGWLGFYLGGLDGLLVALVMFVVADYVTGVMCAITERRLSSSVGFKGIFRKILIFILVGVANELDMVIIGSGNIIRTAVIFFYISNEGISLLENATYLGLPVPEKLKQVLHQLHDKESEGENNEQ
ncbi:phage holin family protein [Aerococcaceae bacterium NML191219]|nr:phage holin family protein [Aerococcaceae bacterium NML191219]